MSDLAFRASWTKLAIQGVNRLPDTVRARVRASIGEDVLATLRQASTVAWLPGDVHLTVLRAIEQELGTIRTRAFFRDRMKQAFESSLVKTLLGGVLRIFEPSPYTVLRASPRVYDYVARNAGIHEVTSPEPNVTVVGFRNGPREICNSSYYALCHGQCLAVFDLVKVSGTVTEDISGLGEFKFIVRNSSLSNR
jgi:hypothetical protein